MNRTNKNATESANSGIMINKRHHAVITKTEEQFKKLYTFEPVTNVFCEGKWR